MLMGMKKKIIAKVHVNKLSGQKLVTIPKKIRSIKEGDYVKISRVTIEDVE